MTSVTYSQLAAVVSASTMQSRDCQAIATAYNSTLKPTNHSLTVEQVFSILYSSGDYVTLKQGQLANDSNCVLAFEILSDAKTLGAGMVDLSLAPTQTLINALVSSGKLSSAGQAALTAAANYVDAVTWQDVAAALEGN